jgi:hypothetical protein
LAPDLPHDGQGIFINEDIDFEGMQVGKRITACKRRVVQDAEWGAGTGIEKWNDGVVGKEMIKRIEFGSHVR